MCGRALKKRCDEGVGHAGERTRQGAVPLGSGLGQVNTSIAALQHRARRRWRARRSRDRRTHVQSLASARRRPFAVAAPAAAQRPPLDPRCPQGDLNAERGPGSVCIGRLTEDYAFAFIYPREAAAIPRLDAYLRNEALRAEVWLERQVAELRAGDPGENRPRLSYEAGWHVDAGCPS